MGTVRDPVRLGDRCVVICKDRLYIVNDNDTESFMVALNKKNRRTDLAS